MKPEIIVIIPTYDERENLPNVLARVMAVPAAVDVLIVDDNSPDGTGQMADEFAAQNPRVHVLHRAEKDGLGRAYCAGFKWALERGYEYIFEMDADLSHNPDAIPAFLAAAQTADLVIGSRYSGGIRVINWPLNRLILSLGAGKYVRMVTGMPFTDPTAGYKCFRRRALQAIDIDQIRSSGYSFQVEFHHKIWRQGLAIVETPIIFSERTEGASKMSLKIVWESLLMPWRLLAQNGFRRRPRPKPSEKTKPLPPTDKN